jgi:hypothetical protein
MKMHRRSKGRREKRLDKKANKLQKVQEAKQLMIYKKSQDLAAKQKDLQNSLKNRVGQNKLKKISII